jgi:hypothetical protein
MTTKNLLDLVRNKGIIKRGYLNTNNFGLDFDEVYATGSEITFTLDDKLRGERSLYYTLDTNLISNIVQNTEESLFGNYTINITLKNDIMIALSFDTKLETDLELYGLSNVNQYKKCTIQHALKEIKDHKNIYLIAIDPFDENGGTGIGLYNCSFLNTKLLHDNTLLCFDNTTEEPTIKNGKEVYTIYSQCNFYVDTKKVENVFELSELDLGDFFEYQCDKGYMFLMQAPAGSEYYQNIVIGLLN